MEKVLYCSFCGISRDEIQQLISGPSVYICDQCINLCNQILVERGVKHKESNEIVPRVDINLV